MKNIVMTGNICDRRGRGRAEEITLNVLRQWHGGKPIELLQKTRDEICADTLMAMLFGIAHDSDDG